jgi:hypothetical protein
MRMRWYRREGLLDEPRDLLKRKSGVVCDLIAVPYYSRET